VGVTIYSVDTKYKCEHCGHIYHVKSDALNFAVATRSLVLGPTKKKCSKCKKTRSNAPYDEYVNKSFVEKILLHLGLWCKYDFTGWLLSIKEMFLNTISSKNPLKYIGFLLFLVASLLGLYIGLIYTFMMNFFYLPFGLIINNIKIIKSIKRTRNLKMMD